MADVVLIKRPGDGEPNGAMALRDGLGVGHDVGDVVDAEIVVVGAGSYGVELDVVDTPRCVEIDDGVDVFLGAGLGEVDLVSVTEAVTVGERLHDDVLRMIRGAVDR